MTATRSPTPSADAADRPERATEPPPSDHSHGTVRLIPMGEAESRIAGQTGLHRSPERDVRQAHERLHQARRAVAAVSAALEEAAEVAATAHDHAERSRVAYEHARMDSRRAELALRQEQRRADDAKLALRQAYEQVAHLEGMRGSPLIDLTA